MRTSSWGKKSPDPLHFNPSNSQKPQIPTRRLGSPNLTCTKKDDSITFLRMTKQRTITRELCQHRRKLYGAAFPALCGREAAHCTSAYRPDLKFFITRRPDTRAPSFRARESFGYNGEQSLIGRQGCRITWMSFCTMSDIKKHNGL